jgi:hypothetical protein
MSSSRARSRPAATASSEEPSLAPWQPSQSLAELRDALTSPGVVQAEVDALFAAIARPPTGDETPRARADFLHSLMSLREEAHEGMTGSDGRTVRAAAVEALLELGFPYALEVDPDVLEDVRRKTQRRKHTARVDSGGFPAGGLVLSLMAVVLQLLVVTARSMLSRHGDFWEASPLFPLALVVLPPLSAVFGHVLESRRLLKLGSIGMGLQSVVWLFLTLRFGSDAGRFGWLLLALIPWYLPLAAACMMYPRTPPEDAASPEPSDASS